MTTLAPPRRDFDLHDRLILEAFWDLQSARAQTARTGNGRNLDRQSRAEEHLNTLLEYRYAARDR